MLDCFEILTTSGVVLWSKSYAPISANIINSLIKEIFIEESVGPGGAPSTVTDVSAARNPTYKKERYTLRWTTAKDLGLIFVAVYQSLLHLSWIDKLLDNVKTLFTSLYRDQFKKPHTSVIDCPFDEYFDRQIQDLEKTSPEAVVTAPSSTSTQPTNLTPPSSAEDEDVLDQPPPPPLPTLRKAPARLLQDGDATSTEITPVPTPDSSRPASPALHLLTAKTGPGGRTSRRARKVAATSAPTSRDHSAPGTGNIAGKVSGKKLRRWDEDGLGDDDDGAVLDYSAQAADGDAATSPTSSAAQPAITQESWSKRTGKGEVVLRDLDDEIDAILSSAAAKQEQQADVSSTSATGRS